MLEPKHDTMTLTCSLSFADEELQTIDGQAYTDNCTTYVLVRRNCIFLVL